MFCAAEYDELSIGTTTMRCALGARDSARTTDAAVAAVTTTSASIWHARSMDSVRPWAKRTSNTVTSPALSAPGYTHSVQPWLGSQHFARLDVIPPANRPTSGRPRRMAWKRSFRFFQASCFDDSACTRDRRVQGRGSRSFLCNET